MSEFKKWKHEKFINSLTMNEFESLEIMEKQEKEIQFLNEVILLKREEEFILFDKLRNFIFTNFNVDHADGEREASAIMYRLCESYGINSNNDGDL